jgi:hypothetical protein
MTKIDSLLNAGEFIVKDQGAVYDQGISNQADGTLYLTNQRILFDVKEGGMYRGLELLVEGQKDAQIEVIEIPLEEISYTEKKRLALEVHTNLSFFREIQGKKGIFKPKGTGRVFENGPQTFRFSVHIFVNKDEWITEIMNKQRQLIELQKEVPPPPSNNNPKIDNEMIPQSSIEQPQVLREKIVIREVIKIKCTYCGTLYEQGRNRCPHCGARI